MEYMLRVDIDPDKVPADARVEHLGVQRWWCTKALGIEEQVQ